jgi:selenocysteine-specific elongation factor
MRALLDLTDVDIDDFRRARNLTEESLASVLAATNPVELVRRGRTFAVPRDRWFSALDALANQIIAYHKTAPHSQGLKSDQIRRTGILPKPWLDDALATLVSTGRIAETGGHYHDRTHRPALPPDDAVLLRQIEALIGAGDQPPSIGDIAKSLAIALRTVDTFIAKMTKLGFLVRVGDNRVLLPRQIDALSLIAQQLAKAGPDGFSAREFRDATQIGRNLVIDVLEYFDRCGFTRRYGDLRRIVGDPSTLKRA